jgi:hypothetical protein
MNLLRSPGLANQTLEDITAELQRLHPSEDKINMDEMRQPGKPLTANNFEFITGTWFARQIRKSSAGTAVDQWGWDSREMWQPFCKDTDLMDLIAECWVRPMAAGYLPAKYRDHLAGGRLIALSKHPKPGIRPICISDAIRRLLGRGLLRTTKQYFKSFFQESSPDVIQFGGSMANGSSLMYHLLSCVDAKAKEQHQSVDEMSDPISKLALDSSNAFNTVTREQLVTVLQQGCESHVKISQPGSFAAPYGWDCLWPYFAAHYGCHGLLKFYHSGSTTLIESKTGVQQGDPLGSSLFALAIHPILLELGDAFPGVFITAYADNVVMSGPLSLVQKAHEAYCLKMQSVGLSVKAQESQLYIPQWRGLSVDQMKTLNPQAGTGPEPNPSPRFQMSNGDYIPIISEGISILGCPLGTPDFCTRQIQSVIADIKHDLDLLAAFPALHQRTKLGIYCSNTRISYMLRAVPIDLSLPQMETLDQYFDQFMAVTLHFERDYTTSAAAETYKRALRQIRLGIKRGGLDSQVQR